MLQSFAPYLSVAEVILAITLTILVLLQTKGADLGGFLGGGGDIGGGFRTRRGIEGTLHKVTIATSAVFLICTLLTFVALGQTA
ncbi:MAG: preprotein translocase subunit SecG [Anaerolineales bacterium]|nr:preprotein translocase subunit SecG [Anaerolineales bacterium]